MTKITTQLWIMVGSFAPVRQRLPQGTASPPIMGRPRAEGRPLHTFTIASLTLNEIESDGLGRSAGLPDLMTMQSMAGGVVPAVTFRSGARGISPRLAGQLQCPNLGLRETANGHAIPRFRKAVPANMLS